MISNELADVRRRFVADAQAGLRRPAVVVGTGLVFVALGAAPLVPAGRALLGVPVAYTATWAGVYLALSVLVYMLYRARGPFGRIPASTVASLRVDAPKEASLEDLVRVSLIRVFQEATANALRHGKARTIETAVAVTDRRIVLSVRDDGTGFDPSVVSEGRGLVGMRARASELGGELRVDTSPGHGTQLHFDVLRVRTS